MTIFALLLILNLVLSVCLFLSVIFLWREHKKSKQQLLNQLSSIKNAYELVAKENTEINKKLSVFERNQTQKKQAKPLGDFESNNQVARLVNLGASVEDLVNEHNVPRGEAELLVSLRDQKTAG